MLAAEFARFVEGLFPSIDPEEAQRCIAALRKYPGTGREFFALTLPDKLCQGDIVEPITFIVQGDDGEFGERLGAGMVLSNSCDIDNDDQLLLAECQPSSLFVTHRAWTAIQSNTFYSTLYLGNTPNRGDVVVDLSQVQTIRKAPLLAALQSGTARRHASLTDLGYYFFVAKLTVFLLRPQSAEEVRGSSPPPRIRDKVRLLVCRLLG